MPTPALAVPRVMEQVGAMEIVNGRMETVDVDLLDRVELLLSLVASK